ncbi:MAG: hypothetical protein ACI4SG_02805 [Oligosphaeraceae bacterium]
MTVALATSQPLSQELKNRRFQRRWDFFVLITLLFFSLALFLPVLVTRRPVPWRPPDRKSFVHSLQAAFAPQDHKAWTPTATVSLVLDYFTFGDDHMVFYRVHSLLGHLVKTAVLWLLLRRLRVSSHYAMGFAFLVAIWPSRIEAVMTPHMRGVIALTLFSYLAMLLATYINSPRWHLWMALCTVCCVFAAGASLWAALLLTAMPAVAWWRTPRGDVFPWHRLVLPELTLLGCLFLSLRMSGYLG